MIKDMDRHYINAHLRNLVRDIHDSNLSGEFLDVATRHVLKGLLRYAVGVNQAVSPDGSTHAVVNVYYQRPLFEGNFETELYNFPYDEDPMPKILQLRDRLLNVPECTKEVCLLAFRDGVAKRVLPWETI